MTAAQILEGDSRRPVAGHLIYGLGIEVPDPRIPMGPNTFGEWLWPVTIERAVGKTRIGFAYQAPPDDSPS